MLVHLKTLGCRLNEAELESWAQGFQKTGHQITRQAEAADLIVINSCAVTHDAARKSRNLIRRIHRENPTAKLVVSGCYASLNRQEAEELMGVDLVIGNQDKNQLVQKTLTELNMDSMPVMSAEPGEMSLFARGRQRAFIKVQDGCRYRCTFCIVTVARGEESSRPIADVLEEINHLNSQNIQEIVLTGVHLGGYGHDRGSNLVELIKAVLMETDVQRLRLGSLEPWELSEEFFELFNNRRVMPHLHLPLQSGSDTVLRRMARRCKTEEFATLVNRLREQIPDFNITTDIIVGFPGETEDEWRENVDFIKQTGFGHMHIFTYSRREGTKAATLPDPVANEVKRERSQQLHRLANELKAQFFAANLGKTTDVLWEGYNEDLGNDRKRVFGYSPNYLRVACDVDSRQVLENSIMNTSLQEATEEFIAGKLINMRPVGR